MEARDEPSNPDPRAQIAPRILATVVCIASAKYCVVCQPLGEGAYVHRVHAVRKERREPFRGSSARLRHQESMPLKVVS